MKFNWALLRYFLFRSTRKVENIERLIRSQGFKIHPFHPEETETHSAKLLYMLGATDYAKSRYSFIAANDIVKCCFIRRNLCERDRMLLLWHEEAHIINEHLNRSGYLTNTTVQKEVEANMLLFNVRMQKAMVYAMPLLCLLFLI